MNNINVTILNTVASNKSLANLVNYNVTPENYKEAKKLRAEANKALEKSNRVRLDLKKEVDILYHEQMFHTLDVVKEFDSKIKIVEREIVESKLEKIDSYLKPEGIFREDYPKSWYNLGKTESDIINELPEFIAQFEDKLEDEVKEVIEHIKLTKTYNIEGTKEEHIKVKLFLQKEGISWE